MSSFDIGNDTDDGSINLSKHGDLIVIEMYDRIDDDEADQRDIQLSFDLDDAKEIHAHLGHLIYLIEHTPGHDTTAACDSEYCLVHGTKQS